MGLNKSHLSIIAIAHKGKRKALTQCKFIVAALLVIAGEITKIDSRGSSRTAIPMAARGAGTPGLSSR
jgi:hypothetical protein